MDNNIKAIISGSFSGSMSVIAGQPFDTIRIRYQTNKNLIGKSIHTVFYDVIKNENFKTLYRGISPALTVATIENCVIFTANRIITDNYRNNIISNKNRKLTLFEQAIIGGGSGIFSAIAISPPELIKVRLQADALKHNNERLYKNTIDCLVKTVNENGIKTLFRGLIPQLARDIPFGFGFFGSYHTFTSMFMNLSNVENKDKLNSSFYVLSGGLAGCVGWTISIPMDVVKSNVSAYKLQNKNYTMMQTSNYVIKKIYKSQGFRGFFNGLGVACVRSFPTNGTLFFAYELCNQYLDKYYSS